MCVYRRGAAPSFLDRPDDGRLAASRVAGREHSWLIIHSRDPNDDYLIAAAASVCATLVTGDARLL